MAMPIDVSTKGVLVDDLVHTTLWLFILVGTAASLLLLYLVIRYRRGTEKKAFPAKGEGIAILIASACAIMVTDAYLLCRSVVDRGELLSVEAGKGKKTLRVQANAQQWFWQFRYAGKDGAFATNDDVVSETLRVPVGTKVWVQVGSADVVHGFHLPELRVKADIIPGRLTNVGFQAERTGQFHVVCAQFCGVSHYRMSADLDVLSQLEFAEYLERAETEALLFQTEKVRAAKEAGKSVTTLENNRNWGWPWK